VSWTTQQLTAPHTTNKILPCYLFVQAEAEAEANAKASAAAEAKAKASAEAEAKVSVGCNWLVTPLSTHRMLLCTACNAFALRAFDHRRPIERLAA